MINTLNLFYQNIFLCGIKSLFSWRDIYLFLGKSPVCFRGGAIVAEYMPIYLQSNNVIKYEKVR
jgi:hypothetical protein